MKVWHSLLNPHSALAVQVLPHVAGAEQVTPQLVASVVQSGRMPPQVLQEFG
jgi:hypothetical protein